MYRQSKFATLDKAYIIHSTESIYCIMYSSINKFHSQNLIHIGEKANDASNIPLVTKVSI